MTATPAHPVLRLVSGDAAPAGRVTPARAPVEAAGIGAVGGAAGVAGVAGENRSAATIAALDPRWIFAVQVKRSLTGGRAAVLRPEERGKLMASARRLGLRAFDASLVIAIVQDGARAGEDPLGRDVVTRLRLVAPELEPGLDDARGGPTWAMLIAAAGVAMLTGATLAAVVLLV